MEFGSSHATHLHFTVRLADLNPIEEEPLFTRITIEKEGIAREISPLAVANGNLQFDLLNFQRAPGDL